jgi:hypothetical protein
MIERIEFYCNVALFVLMLAILVRVIAIGH